MGLCDGCGWLLRFLHWTQKPAHDRLKLYQFKTQKRLEFREIFNEWPAAETPIAFGPGWMLRGDERVVDSSGRILPDHVDAAVAMTIVGGVQAGFTAATAGASSRQQVLVTFESILDDAAGEIIGVNPSVGRMLLSGRVLPEDIGGGTASVFLPDEYYDSILRRRAPGQSAPYARYERFDAEGNLKQVTTYDRFGDRVRQYDLGDSVRHGEGFHTFEYNATTPRQAPGGGQRSDHLPLDHER